MLPPLRCNPLRFILLSLRLKRDQYWYFLRPEPQWSLALSEIFRFRGILNELGRKSEYRGGSSDSQRKHRRTTFLTPEKESSTLPKCIKNNNAEENVKGNTFPCDSGPRNVDTTFRLGIKFFQSTLLIELDSDALDRPTEFISKRGKRWASYKTRVLKKSETGFSEQDHFLTNVSKPSNSFGDINSVSIFLWITQAASRDSQSFSTWKFFVHTSENRNFSVVRANCALSFES